MYLGFLSCIYVHSLFEMTRAKKAAGDVTDSTPLNDVHGWGPQSFAVLGIGGYNLSRRSTVGDFKTATGSLDTLRETLRSSGSSKYVMPKFEALWRGETPSRRGGHTLKRKAPGPSSGESTLAIRQEPSTNFLLEAKQADPDVNTNKDPDLVTSRLETPEVDSLVRRVPADEEDGEKHNTVHGEPGAIAASVDPFVVPDQLQPLAPSDKAINAPLLVIPETDVPHITPAIAIGPSVFAGRMIAPLTSQEQKDVDLAQGELPTTKANGEKDMGGSGSGSLTYNSVLTETNAPASGGSLDDARDVAPNGNGRFRSVPIEMPSSSSSEADGDKEQRPVTTSVGMIDDRHPFRQRTLFKSHDLGKSMPPVLQRSTYNASRLRMAQLELHSYRDGSWDRWNAATQGVRSVDMPLHTSNFLSRGQMTSDFQLHGANDLQLAYSPCPFTANNMMGEFGLRGTPRLGQPTDARTQHTAGPSRRMY
jgi:hypothetical protein